MTTDNKTLADAQPGGRVRLGDQAERARFESLAQAHGFSEDYGHAYEYNGEMLVMPVVHVWALVQSALSAQTSPGGQGDALATRRFIADRTPIPYHRQDVLDGDYDGTEWFAHVQAALAARQPVGEPVAHRLVTGDPKRKWMVVQGAPSIGVIRQAQEYGWEIECFYSHPFKPVTPSWAALQECEK